MGRHYQGGRTTKVIRVPLWFVPVSKSVVDTLDRFRDLRTGTLPSITFVPTQEWERTQRELTQLRTQLAQRQQSQQSQLVQRQEPQQEPGLLARFTQWLGE